MRNLVLTAIAIAWMVSCSVPERVDFDWFGTPRRLASACVLAQSHAGADADRTGSESAAWCVEAAMAIHRYFRPPDPEPDPEPDPFTPTAQDD